MLAGRLFSIPRAATANARDAVTMLVLVVAIDVCQESGVIILVLSHVSVSYTHLTLPTIYSV